jgi:hypothetical protein
LVEDDANKGMVAAAVSDGAADKRQYRQGEPGHFIHPKKGVMEKCTGNDIGEHERKLAKQGRDDEALRQQIDNAHGRVREEGVRFALLARCCRILGIQRDVCREWIGGAAHARENCPPAVAGGCADPIGAFSSGPGCGRPLWLVAGMR